MPVYSYQALDQDGQVVEGVIDADTESTVIASLRGQGRRPLSVSLGESTGKSKGFSLPDLASILGRDKVRTHDLALFTRELATLLRAGMPLDRSLHSLAGLSESEAMKTVVGDVLKMVREGKALSSALTERSTVFPPLYVNMVRAGEAGGVLESVLERLADYMETSEKNREQIRSAMTYPAILGFVGSISIIILLTYVLPRFTVIFEDLGAAMPLSTRIVMGASEFIQNWWFMIILAGVGSWQGFKRWAATPRGRVLLDDWKLRAPLFGDLTRKGQVADFARTLGTMLKSGVPLIQSLEIVREVITNTVISQAVEVVQRDVSEGKGMATTLERSGVFPSLALQMVAVGEETGRLDDMLLVVSEHYDREVGTAITRFMSMLEPAMLMIMGLVTGFIVISMMSAVFSVNELVG